MTMNARWTKTAAFGGWLLCIALSLLWLGSHARARELDEECEALRADNRHLTQRAAALDQTVASTAREIDTKRNTATTRTANAHWHATVLPVIARLKQQHALSPPPPRRPEPPSGPNGDIFPELMNNPEYSRLVMLVERDRMRRFAGSTLAELGLTPESTEKVAGLLAEKEMLRLDYLQLAGEKASRDGFARAQQKQRQEIDAQIRTVMGDEIYQRYDSYQRYMPRQAVTPLETRLSYSDSPLRAEQVDQLAAFVANAGNHGSETLFSESFRRQAQTILTPAQSEALRQLQAEQDAYKRRAKLPKSSELPPNR